MCTALHGTDTDINLKVFLEPKSEACLEEKERVLLALLDRKHFAQARKFADLVGLVDDHVTLKQVSAPGNSLDEMNFEFIIHAFLALLKKQRVRV